ncbi:hypothetical protein ACVIJU_001255 [Aeribacillus sp. SP014]
MVVVVRHNATHGLLNAAAVFVVFGGDKRRAFAFSSDSDKLIGFVPFILVLTVFGPVALRIVRDLVKSFSVYQPLPLLLVVSFFHHFPK